MLKYSAADFIAAYLEAEQEDIANFSAGAYKHLVLGDAHAHLLEEIDHFYKAHKAMPSKERALSTYPEDVHLSLISPTAPEEPISVIYQDLREEAADTLLRELLAREVNNANSNVELSDKRLRDYDDQLTIIKALKSTGIGIAETLHEGFNSTMVRAVSTEILRGISLPVPHIQDDTRGLLPAEYMVVAASTGVGKTWFLLMAALTASTGNPYLFVDPLPGCNRYTKEEQKECRVKTVFVSMEMSKERLWERIIALYARVPVSRIEKQKLTQEDLSKINAVAPLFTDPTHQDYFGDNLLIIDALEGNTIGDATAEVINHNAQLLLIDSFYKLEGPGEKDHDIVKYNSNQLLQFVNRTKKSAIITTQFDTAVTSYSTVTLKALSYSAALGRDANKVIAITPVIGTDCGQVEIGILKSRESVVGERRTYMWNHDTATYGAEAGESFDFN